MKPVVQTAIIIINLLAVNVWCHDGVHLIERLNELYGFDHNIFFMGSSTELDEWFPVLSSGYENEVERLTPKTLHVFNDDVAESGFNVTERVASKCSKNTFLVMVVESLEFEKNSRLLAQVKAIRLVDIKVRIGVFFTDRIGSLWAVYHLFRWSWSIGVVNIFGAFYYSVEHEEPVFNVFKYNPTGAFTLINVTGSEYLRIYFTDKRPNYRHHPLQFLKIKDIYGSSHEMSFWNTVHPLFNASVSQTLMTYEELEISGKLDSDILIHEQTFERYWPGMLYPHRQSTLVALVPHSLPYSDFVEYLKNDTWTLLFGLTAISISASLFLLIVSGYLHKQKIVFFQCISDVANLLMNDNGAIRYRTLYAADAFVVVPLTFAGLIAVNGILSVFQSYITFPIYQPQMNSFNELYTSTVHIVANEVKWKGWIAGLLEGLTNFGGWANKIHGISWDQLILGQDTFNNSAAFFMFNSWVQSYLEAQKRLGLKAFHLSSEISLGRTLINFELNANFPFVETIQDIIHRLNGAGLIDKWMQEESETMVKRWVRKNFQIENRIEPDEDAFTIPTVVWCGWITSVVVFICELIWNKIKFRIRSLIERVSRMR